MNEINKGLDDKLSSIYSRMELLESKIAQPSQSSYSN